MMAKPITNSSRIALSSDSVFNEKNYTDHGESTVVSRVLVDMHNFYITYTQPYAINTKWF